MHGGSDEAGSRPAAGLAARLARTLRALANGLFATLMIAPAAAQEPPGAAPPSGPPVLTATVDDATALPRLTRGGEAMKAQYLFFGAQWAWTGQSVEVQPAPGLARRFSGRNEGLGTRLQGEVEAPRPGVLQWRWRFTAEQAKKPVIGGGIEFEFDLAAHGAALGEPSLLPGHRGFTWGRPGGERIEVRFEPALAQVFFEQGQKNRLRAYFYRDAIAAGTVEHTATVTVSGGARVGPSTAMRFGLDRAPSWPLVRLDAPELALDLSFLNQDDKPAGRRGMLRADGERLVWPDGTPARFWGTNVAAYALFATPKERVPAAARRLARLGFNLVRLHHIDSPWVSPNLFGDAAGPSTRNLDAAALDRLHWWIHCLQQEGIHVWLDLQVQRHVKAADGIDHFDELPRAYDHGHRDTKGFIFVNPSLQAAADAFSTALLGSVNPYNRRRLAEDPGIVALQITNENDLTFHFGNRLLPDKQVPRHSAVYMAAAERFAQRFDLPRDRTWRSWEPGPSKLFLNDLEAAFHRDRIAHLRRLGVKAPLSTTSQWGDSPLFSLPALTLGELIDVHSYGAGGDLESSPASQSNLVHYIAASQLIGRPLTVSEWAMGRFPLPDRHTLPLYMAATAARQGWDALMQYAWSQQPLLHEGSIDDWGMFNDPSMLVPMAAAAVMYRLGHVAPSTTVHAFMPTPAQLYGTGLSAFNAPALRVAAERGRLVIGMPATPELPWLRADAVPAGARVIAHPERIEPPLQGERIASDTGETVRDWGQGTFTVDTPRSQAAMGMIGGREIRLRDVDIAVLSPNASVSVHSLDGRPIAESQDLLVALTAVNLPDRERRGSHRSQPLGGTVSIRAPAGLQATALTEGRSAVPRNALRHAGGRYTIELGDTAGARWLRLRSAP